MAEQVVVLGANGRFGRAAVKALGDAGWQVRAATRSGQHEFGPGVEGIAVDGFDAALVTRAAEGSDVIVNAFNPPYARWSADVPRLTASVIAAARATGATVMIPGNVYNYGADMPARLSETTPHAAATRKGRIRIDMEAAYRAAASDGVRTIVLRAGDFIEGKSTGNWFESQIAAGVARGRAMYPGPRDVVHAWAYLPDMARALVGLAEKRSAFAPFEEFAFGGYNVTGDGLIAAMERAIGRPLKVGGMPWAMLRVVGLFNPDVREVLEMRYLWRTPHAIDGAKLAAALPEFRATPFEVAITQALDKTTATTSALPGHAVTA